MLDTLIALTETGEFEDSGGFRFGLAQSTADSIHVSVMSEQVSQAFLYFEPTSAQDIPPRRRWWQF
jgi:hypothetical protein